MAYMNQAKKAKIAAALREVMPKSYKYSLRVENHSTIVLTISKGPLDLNEAFVASGSTIRKCYEVNTYWLETNVVDADVLKVLQDAKACLNIDNYDKSDIQTDYFNVGHYIRIQFGTYKKPFVNVLQGAN